MNQTQTISKIAVALLKAQQKMGSAVKDADNPYFKSKYADLGAVMEACKDALNENEIMVLQPVHTYSEGTFVETHLIHVSGESMWTRLRISPKNENNAQDVGSAITYARRYALQSFLFIPAEDDDGNGAVGKSQPQPQQKEHVDYGKKVEDTTPEPVQEALVSDSNYSKDSKAMLGMKVKELMDKGKIEKNYAQISKMTREELIGVLENTNG